MTLINSPQELQKQIQEVKEEILKLGTIPLRFEINDKVIDTRTKLDDLKLLLRHLEQQLRLHVGISIYQGPDKEIY